MECDSVFKDLKGALTSKSVLKSSAVLLQETEGERHPVLLLSCKLLDGEMRYSTEEKTDHHVLQWFI